MKLEEGKYQEKCISYIETYYYLTPTNENKVIRQPCHNFNKQTSNRQRSYHEYYFSMNFYEYSNGLASTIVWNCSRDKHEKHYSNHPFRLHITQQSKHQSGWLFYEASKWYILNFHWVFGTKVMVGGGIEPTKLLGMLNIPWQGFEKNFHKNWKMQA